MTGKGVTFSDIGSSDNEDEGKYIETYKLDKDTFHENDDADAKKSKPRFKRAISMRKSTITTELEGHHFTRRTSQIVDELEKLDVNGDGKLVSQVNVLSESNIVISVADGVEYVFQSSASGGVSTSPITDQAQNCEDVNVGFP